MLSIMVLPIFGKNYENVEEYLEEQKVEDEAHIRDNICGTEIIVEKKGCFWPMGYLLSCPEAKKFMKTLMQIEDKTPYSVTLLKIDKHDKEGFIERKVVENISIEEAHKALEAFTANMNDRLAQLMEKRRQYNIKEYEKKFGSSEKIVTN